MATAISSVSEGQAQGRIGPNAVIRVAEGLDAFEGRAVTGRVFSASHIAHYLKVPPSDMVAESDVTALHRELHATLGLSRARSVAWIAGQRTADYLLSNRIPKPVQKILKVLPSRLASRVFLAAISRNAWTFAGSGRFSYKLDHPVNFSVADCPICRGLHTSAPCCDYYAATFERLFAELVHPEARVVETACAAMGARACNFHISWSRRRINSCKEP
jgi:divinyl protochlorophyllide a 8-vinyl-reductase